MARFSSGVLSFSEGGSVWGLHVTSGIGKGRGGTGRLLRAGKRGAIPPELAPILARLDLSVEAWLATMLGWRMFAFSSALGHAAIRAAEAGRRGLAWIRNRCPLFAAGIPEQTTAA